MELVPCTVCARHLRSDEKACPFCGAQRRVPVAAKAGIAAGLALGLGLAVAGCGDATPAYGLPPYDAGPALDASVPRDAGADAGGPIGAYGPPPTDAG